MSDKIGIDDLFDEGLQDYIKDLNGQLKEFASEAVSIKKKLGETKQSTQSNPLNNSADIKREMKDAADYQRLKNQIIEADLKALKLISEAAKQKEKDDRAAIKTEQDKQKAQANSTKEQAKATKETERANSAYYKLSRQLIDQKKAVKDLLASNKELSEKDKELIENTQELDRRLKEIDGTVGDNQRNVGAYKEALQDISAEFGVFGGLLSKITRTLKTLEEQGEHSSTTFQKVGNFVKAAGIAIVLGFITAVIAANDAANELSQALKRQSDIFDINNLATEKGREIALAYAKSQGQEGVAGSLNEARQALSTLIILTERYNESLRRLGIDLEKLKLENDELNQIGSDSTIGFNERIIAQKKSLELNILIAAKQKEIAQAEFNQAQSTLKANEKVTGTGNAPLELKNKLTEATKQLMEAEAGEKLVQLTNATAARQINEEKASEEVKLLISKKESAHEAKAILEAQLKDEKIQLTERRKIATELANTEKRTTQEALKLFKEDIGIRFKNSDLLQEHDDILLAKKIRNLKTLEGHGLGAEGVQLLAKIIKDSQQDEITYVEGKKKRDEEEIKNLERIARIKKEISIISLQINDIDRKREIEIAKEAYEKDKTKANFEYLRAQTDIEFSYRVEIINQQSEIEKQAEIEKREDAAVTQKELEKIEAKRIHDVHALEVENAKSLKQLDKEREDDLRAQREKEINAINDFAEKATGRKNKLQEQQLNNDLDMRQRHILQQQQLAEQGYENTLAFEKAAEAKDELRKQQLAIKEEKQAKRLALFKLLSSAANNENPVKALAESLAVLATATALTAFDGTEDTGGAGTLDKKGGKAWILHPHEGVVNRKGNEANPGLVGAMNKGAVDEFFEENYLPKYMTDGNTESFAQNTTNALLLQQFSSMNQEIKSIKKALKDRPVGSLSIDKDGVVSKREYRNGLIKVSHSKSTSPNNMI